jgi:hypothetical protein
MGLSIARTIIEAHHGLIWAKNRDHGGTSFRIKLPLSREATEYRLNQLEQRREDKTARHEHQPDQLQPEKHHATCSTDLAARLFDVRFSLDIVAKAERLSGLLPNIPLQ